MSGVVWKDFASEAQGACPSEFDLLRQSGRCRVGILPLPPEFLQPVEKASPAIFNPVDIHGDFLWEVCSATTVPILHGYV